MIFKQNEDLTKKGNYRPPSFVNIDIKMLNKILTNQIKNTFKRSFSMIYQICTGGSIHINQ